MRIKLFWEFYHCIIYIANQEIVINHHLLRMKTFNMTVINNANVLIRRLLINNYELIYGRIPV